ncbi:cytochrome c [Methylibium sp.]|uniref:c-type cytochrome n=1 Tax=Methylibium sp. TaxID=2067992 RepID=UPI0025F9B475|nr:cytochrome c [Methylibium sp.]
MGKKHYGYLCAALGAYLAWLLAYALFGPPTADRIDADSPRLVTWGRAVYASHCAACHGAELEGQAGWRRLGPDGRLPAPPHDESGHTWHHGDRYLIRVVERGIVAGVDRPPDYEGNMPAFGQTLSPQEIVAVMSFIKSSWSFDYRAWQEQATSDGAH